MHATRLRCEFCLEITGAQNGHKNLVMMVRCLEYAMVLVAVGYPIRISEHTDCVGEN